MASYSYRTATTAYPCSVPDLGDSAGAGRMRLAVANIQLGYLIPNKTRIKKQKMNEFFLLLMSSKNSVYKKLLFC